MNSHHGSNSNDDIVIGMKYLLFLISKNISSIETNLLVGCGFALTDSGPNANKFGSLGKKVLTNPLF